MDEELYESDERVCQSFIPQTLNVVDYVKDGVAMKMLYWFCKLLPCNVRCLIKCWKEVFFGQFFLFDNQGCDSTKFLDKNTNKALGHNTFGNYFSVTWSQFANLCIL